MGSVTRELARRKIDKFLNETRAEVELATTTFGPLDKYVAANDNELVGNVMNSPLNSGLIGTAVPHGYTTDTAGNIRPLSSDAGQYIGLTRNTPSEPPRTGDFMQTFTGRQYWPCDPRPNEVYIEDIAHSLSLQCRYAGHCIKFYSVAEHSVLIARHLAAKHAPEVALAGLLHDAPEAYCVDIPRPLKPYLTNYKEIEHANWLAIARRFQIDADMPVEVHDADNRIIADELVNLREIPWHARYAGQELGVKLRYWSPEEAELEFLATFDGGEGVMGEDTKVAAFWLAYIAVALVALGYFVGTFAAKGPSAVIFGMGVAALWPASGLIWLGVWLS